MLAGRLFCVAIGLVLGYSAYRAIARGQLTLRGGIDIRRDQDRGAFWVTIAATIGVALICMAVGLPLVLH